MKKNDTLFILIIVITLFAIYWNTFGYEMVWDSKLLFEDNILFEQNKPLSSAFKIGYFREQMGVGNIDFYYRPLLTASFMLEHKTWGIHPSTLRITNLIIYIFSLFFLFLFFKKQSEKSFFAEMIVIIFAFNPLNVENIVWIVGRGDLLLLLWGSLAFLFLELFIQKKHYRYLICSSSFYLLGILSKESFLYFLPLLCLYEFIRRKRISIPYHLANLLITLLFFIVKSRVLEIKSLGFIPLSDIPARAKYLVPSLGYYVRAMFFPVDYDMFSPLDHLTSPLNMALGVGFILAFLFTVHLHKKKQEIIAPLSLMFIFISGHLLLLFTALYPYKVYARYMMIPILGLVWIFAILIRRMKEKSKLAIVFILAVIFIPTSILNGNVFKNEISYFLKALQSFPNDSYLLFQTAKAFYDSEDYLSAELYLSKTLSIPTSKDTATLIRILFSDIDFKRAKYDNVFKGLKKIESFELSQQYRLAPLIRYQISWKRILVSIYKGETESAVDFLQENIKTYPDRIESYFELHRLYTSYSQWNEAKRVEEMVKTRFQSTQGLDSDQIRAGFNSFSKSEKIAFYIQNRNFQAAIETINSLEPLDLEHNILLVKLNYWKGDEEEGLGIIKDILSEQPESFEVHNRIGLFYLQDLIRVRQALVHFNKSLKLNPSQPKVESIILRLNEDYLQKLNVVRTENDS